MKIIGLAVENAKKKQQQQIDFDFCIEQLVCPECAEEMEIVKVNIPPPDMPLYTSRDLKCSKCKFTHMQIMKD